MEDWPSWLWLAPRNLKSSSAALNRQHLQPLRRSTEGYDINAASLDLDIPQEYQINLIKPYENICRNSLFRITKYSP